MAQSTSLSCPVLTPRPTQTICEVPGPIWTGAATTEGELGCCLLRKRGEINYSSKHDSITLTHLSADQREDEPWPIGDYPGLSPHLEHCPELPGYPLHIPARRERMGTMPIQQSNSRILEMSTCGKHTELHLHVITTHLHCASWSDCSRDKNRVQHVHEENTRASAEDR